MLKRALSAFETFVSGCPIDAAAIYTAQAALFDAKAKAMKAQADLDKQTAKQ